MEFFAEKKEEILRFLRRGKQLEIVQSCIDGLTFSKLDFLGHQ